MSEIALFITFLMGLFILIGGLIGFYIKKNQHILKFIMSLAVGVIIPLVLLELLPEVIEIYSEEFSIITTSIILLMSVTLGFMILKILDKFIPDHSHKCNGDICKHSFYHIGVMSFIVLMIHDFIEGMAVFSAASIDLKLGVTLMLGVGFHNVPLGALIASTISKATENTNKTIKFLLMISAAPLLGGLIVYTNPNLFSSELLLGGLLGITAGMLIYILLFELLRELELNKNTFLGIITGLIIMVIAHLI